METKDSRFNTVSQNRALRIVGLTGGIASGKTVATDALRRAGYTVIDADEVSRALTARGTPFEAELAALFPAAASPSGALDRKALLRLIGADDGARKKLDEYTHPRISARISELISSTPPPVVLSAPLLYETALSALCDAVVCVVCPKSVRIQRLIARDGLCYADAERIIDMQTPDAVRATLAEYCLPSNIEKDVFESNTVALFDSLLCIRP